MRKFLSQRQVIGGLGSAVLISTAFGLCPAVLASAEFQRHYELGKDFLQRQEYKLAIQELDIAAAKPASKGEMSQALVDRGTAYSELKNYKAAIADFDRAITLDGSAHLAYNNRGVVYFRQGMATPAIADFDKAIALDGSDKYAVVNRAGAYLMTDNAAKLAPVTEAWIKKNWHSDFACHATVLTALAYLVGGDKAHAAGLTAEALKALDKLLWPYQMLSYLAGKTTAEKVVDVSQESTYDLTQAQCFLGVDAYIKGKEHYDVARNKLDFVIQHGTTNSVEYWVGKYFMTKLSPAATAVAGQKKTGNAPPAAAGKSGVSNTGVSKTGAHTLPVKTGK